MDNKQVDQVQRPDVQETLSKVSMRKFVELKELFAEIRDLKLLLFIYGFCLSIWHHDNSKRLWSNFAISKFKSYEKLPNFLNKCSFQGMKNWNLMDKYITSAIETPFFDEMVAWFKALLPAKR